MAAIRNGGVHTGAIIRFRKEGRHRPRWGTEITHARIGGRTTWWCPEEQV
jgi:formamidopyrimidine-DNA glycosylase